ncbi:MAG: DMT family transporter [Burkholderiaceae bacterium]
MPVSPTKPTAAEGPTVPPRAIILLILMTLVWGTNWPLFSYALHEVSVWTFRTISLPVTGLVLLSVAASRGQSLRIPRASWITVAGVCFFYQVIWNVATPLSASLIASGQSAVLGFSMPIWVALLSGVILKERITFRVLCAVLLGATGIIMLMVPSFDAYAQAPLGVGLGLLAGFGWAIGTIILKKNPVPVPPLVLVGWLMLLTSVPVSIGAALTAQGPWFVPSWQSIAAIAYISLIPMTIGNLCWFSIVTLLPANIAGISTIMVPVVAMLSGAVIHGEPLGWIQLSALMCSVTAMALVLIRKAPGVASD